MRKCPFWRNPAYHFFRITSQNLYIPGIFSQLVILVTLRKSHGKQLITFCPPFLYIPRKNQRMRVRGRCGKPLQTAYTINHNARGRSSVERPLTLWFMLLYYTSVMTGLLLSSRSPFCTWILTTVPLCKRSIIRQKYRQYVFGIVYYGFGQGI